MSVMSEMDLTRNETDREISLFENAEETTSMQKSSETTTAPQATTSVASSSAPSASVTEETEEEKRRAHEEAEAKRKAEWEAKKKAREEEILIAWEKAIDVTDDQLSEISVKRLGDMTEWLTRRNMKMCVTEYVQTLCYEDTEFARNAMHPQKSMINCFKYINRKALEYLKQFQKDSGEKPINGVLGGDVPDDLCYQWAKEYFMDLNAEEDKTEEEKFVPKPYTGKSAPKPKKKETKKKSEPKKTEPAKNEADNPMQITLEAFQQTFSQEGAD